MEQHIPPLRPEAAGPAASSDQPEDDCAPAQAGAQAPHPREESAPPELDSCLRRNTEADAPQLEDFEPVPLRTRHDGWTPERQRTFLEALARCGDVKAAALYTGLSRESAYRLRRRPEGRAFARAWDAALILARDLYAETLLDKGLNGWREEVWYHGEEVGHRTRFCPQLFARALARLDKAADGLDLAGNPARAAAAQFDELVAAIGEGEDCADLLSEQDATAQPPPAPESDRSLMDRLRINARLEAIRAADPAAIDTSDLDPADADDWDDEQWARAERSGMAEEWGLYDEEEEDEVPPRHGEGDRTKCGGGAPAAEGVASGEPPPSALRAATSPSRGGTAFPSHGV